MPDHPAAEGGYVTLGAEAVTSAGARDGRPIMMVQPNRDLNTRIAPTKQSVVKLATIKGRSAIIAP